MSPVCRCVVFDGAHSLPAREANGWRRRQRASSISPVPEPKPGHRPGDPAGPYVQGFLSGRVQGISQEKNQGEKRLTGVFF